MGALIKQILLSPFLNLFYVWSHADSKLSHSACPCNPQTPGHYTVVATKGYLLSPTTVCVGSWEMHLWRASKEGEGQVRWEWWPGGDSSARSLQLYFPALLFPRHPSKRELPWQWQGRDVAINTTDVVLIEEMWLSVPLFFLGVQSHRELQGCIQASWQKCLI